MNHLGMESNPDDTNALVQLFRRHNCRRVIEVGTWVGATAARLIPKNGCLISMAINERKKTWLSNRVAKLVRGRHVGVDSHTDDFIQEETDSFTS